jgi:hypothetical protein
MLSPHANDALSSIAKDHPGTNACAKPSGFGCSKQQERDKEGEQHPRENLLNQQFAYFVRLNAICLI